MAEENSGELSKTILKVCQGATELYQAPNIYQIIKITPFQQANTGQNRVRVDISDGAHYMEALVATSTQSYFESEEVIVGSVIQVNNMTINAPNGKKIMILLGFEILQKDCEILGEPVDISTVIKPTAPAPSNRGAFGTRPAFGNQNQGGFGGRTNNNAFGAPQRNNNPFGGPTKGSTSRMYQPLSDLSPFQKQAFTIKVRVTRKGTIRHWSNKRGDGKLFSIDILDDQGNEMQCTMFNDVVDKFFPVFEEGKIYTIHKGRIKMANKRYTHITSEYSLDLNQDTVVERVADDAGIAGMKYDFKPISALAEMEDRSFMDVYGIIDAVSEVQRFTSKKSGNELTKRTFRIVDQSSNSVECVLWGDEAVNFPESNIHNPVAIKAARVSEFNGKSLSVNKYEINPNIPEIAPLVQWWSTEGQNAQIKSFTTARTAGGRNEPPISIREVQEGDYGLTEEAKYFNTKITIRGVPHEPPRVPWYNAVPEEAKDEEGKSIPAYKVIADGNGGWMCERNGTTYSTCTQRYILRVRGIDHTGEQWFNAYDDAARILMGVPASEIYSVFSRSWDENNEPNWSSDADEETYNQYFERIITRRFNIRVRARADTYQDEARRRFDILGATPIDDVEDATAMLKDIGNWLDEEATVAA